MLLHVVAIVAGVICILPVLYAVVGFIGAWIVSFAFKGPDWALPAIILTVMIVACVSGVGLVAWGVS